MTRIVRRMERRRSGWGKLWRLAFVLFNGVMVYDVLTFTSKVAALRRGADPLAAVFVRLASQSVMSEHLLIWLAGAVVLGLLCWMTRGQLLIIDEPAAKPQIKLSHRDYLFNGGVPRDAAKAKATTKTGQDA
jgi:hypothetical protein